MKLTIGMIVKNEEKWLEKCLTAIEPILDNVDCELIITDTGSTDRTVEIAKRFTDKVLYFEWCNDFAAARNTALDIAKGEWFMFLDADEIFKSCNGIVDFFNSGEYSEYRSAAYTIRNLTASGTGSEFWARRMTRIDAGTRFESAVHEHLNTFGEPIKYLNDMAYHYGYLYQSDEDKQRKFDRNYDILKKKFDEVKDSNPMVYSELYDMLATVGRQKEADEYMDAGIRLCIKLEHPLIILFYCKKARHLLFEQQNEAALEICDKYFSLRGSIKSGRIYSDAEILVVKATALYRLKDFKQTVETLVTFFDTFNDMKSGKLDTKDKMYGSLNLAGDSNYIAYVGQFLDCCLRTGQYEKAAKYMFELPISKYSEDRDTVNGVIELELVLLEHVDVGYLDKFAGQLDEYGKKKLVKRAQAKFSVRTDPKKIKLTIGMIVKNEEKWLEKCLTAIKPILDNVDCELIITDTGSTDRTVEIAEKYADKVLHFEWIRDFSAARNTVFEVAKGEWFMFVDADNIFTSCDSIINFFNSGEYKKYNSATHIIKNYFKSDIKDSFSEEIGPRLTKILPETKFVGAVHETLSTLGYPIKDLSDIAEHYGYVSDDENLESAKKKRNEDILLKELDGTKDERRKAHIYLLLHESLRVSAPVEAENYLYKGIEIAQKIGSIYLIPMLRDKVMVVFQRKQYDEVVSICNQYFALDKDIRSGELCSDAEFYAAKAECLYRLERFSEADSAFKNYFRVFHLTDEGKLATRERYILTPVFAGSANYVNMLIDAVVCASKLDDIEGSRSYILSSKVYKFNSSVNSSETLVDIIIQIMDHTGYSDIDKYCAVLDAHGKQELLNRTKGKFASESDKKRCKLTIGMIVKNEEKWLEKCLTAIKPILDNVDSELIITDTGSTDRTVEIAKMFTDKVLHFEWIGDFSAARNTCIEAANGEWFMSLDADEIFQSCDGIIDFFNSGEYKQYNSASFIVRNLFKSENGISNDMFLELRMAKLTPETKFVGRIHEYMEPIDPPYKNIRDIADHYGYYYMNKEESKKKFERNTELLLQKLEEEQDRNIMLYVQIYQSYMLVDDDERAMKYLDKGIEVGRAKNDYALIALLYHKIAYYYTKKDYEQAIEVCKDYFVLSRVINKKALTTDGEIYSIRGGSFYRLGRYDEAINDFKKFFELYRDIESGKLATYDAYLISLSMCTDVNYLPTVNEFLDSCIKADRYNTADAFLLSFPASKYSLEISEIARFVKYEIRISEYFQYKNVRNYYKQLNEIGKKVFVDELFGLISCSDKSENVLNALYEIANDNKKLSDKVEVYRNYYQNDDISESIRNYIYEYGTAEDVDLISIAMQKQYDISCVFADDIDIKRLAYSCCKGLSDFYSVAEKYDVKCFADNEKLPQLAEFYKYIMDTALLSYDDKKHIPELLRRFADCGIESSSEILQAAALVKNVIQLRENKRYKECIVEIKHAINIYELLGAVLSEYSKLVLNEYEKAAKAAQSQNEMQALAVAIKKNIRAFIAAGNFDAARKTLNDYASINPSDEEIPELLKQIGQ